MTCTAAREQLSLYVSDDLTLPERRAIEAHLAGCAECRGVVEQYRTLAGALGASLPGLEAPARPPRASRKRWTWIPAAAALLVVTLAAVPQARAEVANQVARLFGWHSLTVRTQAPVLQDAQGQPVKNEDATVSYDRDLSSMEPTVRQVTTSLAAAREFLGHGVALPPAMEGDEMLLYRIEEPKSGTLLLVGLSSSKTGFSARYRPEGELEKINVTYGAGFSVTTEERILGGRPAKIITAMQESGKGSVDIWIQDGRWVYEMHGYHRDMEKLIQMAESLD